MPKNLEWPKLFSHRNVRDVRIIRTLSKDEVTRFSPALAPGSVCDLQIFRRGCHLGNVYRCYLLQDYLLLSLHTIQRTVEFVLWSKGKISSSEKGWDSIEVLCTCENSSSFTKTDQSPSPALSLYLKWHMHGYKWKPYTQFKLITEMHEQIFVQLLTRCCAAVSWAELTQVSW